MLCHTSQGVIILQNLSQAHTDKTLENRRQNDPGGLYTRIIGADGVAVFESRLAQCPLIYINIETEISAVCSCSIPSNKAGAVCLGSAVLLLVSTYFE